MQPAARFRGKGERRTSALPDPGQTAALEDAARAVAKLMPSDKKFVKASGMIAQTAVATYVLSRAKQAFSDEGVKRALSSERPWDMVRLIDKTVAETAVIESALPIVGELVSEMDPTGEKPFFDYSREDILRLFEAVIWCWEESQDRVAMPDDAPHAGHTRLVEPPTYAQQAAINQTAMADDEIPF